MPTGFALTNNSFGKQEQVSNATSKKAIKLITKELKGFNHGELW